MKKLQKFVDQNSNYDSVDELIQEYKENGFSGVQYRAVFGEGGSQSNSLFNANDMNQTSPITGKQLLKAGIAIVDFTLSTGEAIGGVGIMILSPSSGPGLPPVFWAGLGIAGHGALGMENSAIDLKNALYNQSQTGILQTIGNSLFGDMGGDIGKMMDFYMGLRGGTAAAGAINGVRDVYEVGSAVNSMDNSFGN